MTDLNSSDASRPEEMALDIWRDLLRTIAREHVVGARDDHQFGARQSRHEVAADGERTDRIGIAPDQERRRLHLGEAWRKVDSITRKPIARRWRIPRVLLTPGGGAEAAHVDRARRRRENEAPNESGCFERGADGEDAAHRLRDEIDGAVNQPQHGLEE